ncbi:Protein of unknown function DUF484 [hydrothermal vent metagenome]|uniref:DUF484 family protein n=1 Tax=hydrothermal vent metagenome TaxID=652676 RepID=A0A3B0ZHX2_9ZZZZ
MTKQQESEAESNVHNEQSIAQFLLKNTDFFCRNSAVLEQLLLPHHTGAAVSLIERQVTVLQAKNRLLTSQLRDLIHNARENDKLNNNMQDLTIALLECRNTTDILETVQHHLKNQFSAEALTFPLLFAPSSLANNASQPTAIRLIPKNDSGLKTLKKLLERETPLCGKLSQKQLDIVFGSLSSDIKSAAIIPLQQNGKTFGAIAIGSKDEKRFQADMGTIFLSHLGKMVSQALQLY